MIKPKPFTTGLVVTAVAMSLVSIAAFETLSAAPAAKLMPATATMPTAAEHEAEATELEHEAADLELKATQHAAEAARYRALARFSKFPLSFMSLANHCDGLAKTYRNAAHEALVMAASHRDMAKNA